MRKGMNIIALFLFFSFFVGLCHSQQKGVEVKLPRFGMSADVTINGEPFTSYMSKIRSLDIGKPIFCPIYSARGTVVTRGWPLVTDISGEQEDHPHHTGAFFTYGEISAGEVKGLNFWGGRAKGERIRLLKIADYKSDKDYGLLESVALWETPETGPILEQTQKTVFRYDNNSRIIDYDITLKGLKVPVVFEDTKEGGLGLRVHHELTEKVGSGSYINAEGLEIEKNVWGKRSKWVALHGKIKDEPIVIGIFFNPESHNYPPYWHARGYGLFVANPFGGRNMFTNKEQPPLSTTINPGDSIKLKYRLLVYSGELTKEQLEQQFNLYLKQSAGSK